jgi:hypothetical protein
MDSCWVAAVAIAVAHILKAVRLSPVFSSQRLSSAPGESRHDFLNLWQRKNAEAVGSAFGLDAQLVGESLNGVRMTRAKFRAFRWRKKLRASLG